MKNLPGTANGLSGWRMGLSGKMKSPETMTKLIK